ncbi:hypothetical protein ABPG72_000437 [Tetrahymena utriculariae]
MRHNFQNLNQNGQISNEKSAKEENQSGFQSIFQNRTQDINKILCNQQSTNEKASSQDILAKNNVNIFQEKLKLNFTQPQLCVDPQGENIFQITQANQKQNSFLRSKNIINEIKQQPNNLFQPSEINNSKNIEEEEQYSIESSLISQEILDNNNTLDIKLPLNQNIPQQELFSQDIQKIDKKKAEMINSSSPSQQFSQQSDVVDTNQEDQKIKFPIQLLHKNKIKNCKIHSCNQTQEITKQNTPIKLSSQKDNNNKTDFITLNQLQQNPTSQLCFKGLQNYKNIVNSQYLPKINQQEQKNVQLFDNRNQNFYLEYYFAIQISYFEGDEQFKVTYFNESDFSLDGAYKFQL